jgi:hypothetical protein
LLNEEGYFMKLNKFLALLASIFFIVGASPSVANAAGPGQWSGTYDMGMNAIHTQVLPNGNVAFYGTDPNGNQDGSMQYGVFYPATNTKVILGQTTNTAIFCSISTYRPEVNRVDILGGDIMGPNGATNVGNSDVVGLSPDGSNVFQLPDMQVPRWYATSVTMPNGDTLVLGGKDGGEAHPEVFRYGQGESEYLDHLNTAAMQWWYPRAFVMADGSVLVIDTNGKIFRISPTLSTFVQVGQIPAPYAPSLGVTMVAYAGDKIIVHDRTGTFKVDATNPVAPVVTQITGPTVSRQWADFVLLPNGKVALIGGNSNALQPADKANQNQPLANFGPVYQSELWDPVTGTWTDLGGNINKPRLYHSTTTLMPDGRILAAGGGSPGPIIDGKHYNPTAEIFTPPYLVGNPTRPALWHGHGTFHQYGETFNVKVSENGHYTNQLMLIGAGSETHSMSTQERRIVVPTTRTIINGDVYLSFTLNNPNVITPGLYHLIAMSTDGIPSKSVMFTVWSGAPTQNVPDPPPYPAPPAGVNAFVNHVYWTMFDRAPDVAGGQYWTQQMANGMSEGTLLYYFADSQEFINLTGTTNDTPGYVTRLYLGFLGRQPEPSGHNYWVVQINNGASKTVVAQAFADSLEAQLRFGL